MTDAPQSTGQDQSIGERWAGLRRRIERAGGDPDAITVVTVTKAFGPDTLTEVLDAGILDVGESYAPEVVAKGPLLAGHPGARLHFIGRLQRNKVRAVAPFVALWQSVDRLELGAEIARRAPEAAVLVQVNATAEPQKGGCDPADTRGLVAGLLDLDLQVRGLMAVGKQDDPTSTARAFSLVVEQADDLGLPVRSLGMSEDLELAVAAGSTMVRVGRDLLGPRPARIAQVQVEPEDRLE